MEAHKEVNVCLIIFFVCGRLGIPDNRVTSLTCCLLKWEEEEEENPPFLIQNYSRTCKLTYILFPFD